MIVSSDMDDTLIPNQVYYRRAKAGVAELVRNEVDSSLTRKEIIDKLDGIDYEKYADVGVTRTRFAESCRDLVSVYTDDEELKQRAYEIGMNVFKSRDYYSDVGCFDGFSEFISTVDEISDHSVLVTEGIEKEQEKKISANQFRNHFDEVFIVDDKRTVFELLVDEYDSPVVHIGNSLSSDIEPALQAGCEAVLFKGNDWNSDHISFDEDDEYYEVSSLSMCAELLDDLYN